MAIEIVCYAFSVPLLQLRPVCYSREIST